MRLSELSASDLKFMENYELAYQEYNVLKILGSNLTSKGIEKKKEALNFIKSNLDRYMKLTN